MPVSNEEQSLIEMIESSEEDIVKRQDLDERQQELARKMVSRGVLERVQKDGSIHYKVSRLDDIWR